MANVVQLPTGKLDAIAPVYYGMAQAIDPLEFMYGRAVKSAPGIFNPVNILDKNRDWEYAYINPHDGFNLLRWCPSWIRTDAQAARWQPAGLDIYRVQRKGEAGAEARTLVFTCSPSTLAIPAGESIVVWDAIDDVTVSNTTTRNLFGYNLPLKTKLTVSGSAASTPYDTAGRSVVEVDTGQILPVIDYLPPFFSGENGIQKSTLQLRHWSFYANAATKALRVPFTYFFDYTRRAVMSGGHVMLGGNCWAPTNYDWSKDYFNFGETLTRELFQQECNALADMFGDLPPSRLAVELESDVQHAWANNGTVPGYKTLLNDVWYPTARQAWGQERTLVVKGPGGASGTFANFDWSPPKGERAHLGVKTSDADINDFTDISETDLLANTLRAKINTLGFAGGGVTSLTINAPQNTVEKAKRIGRVLTSCYNQGLYTILNCHTNSDPMTTINVADVFNINGLRIEALYPEMRQYAGRAGLITA